MNMLPARDASSPPSYTAAGSPLEEPLTLEEPQDETAHPSQDINNGAIWTFGI